MQGFLEPPRQTVGHVFDTLPPPLILVLHKCEGKYLVFHRLQRAYCRDRDNGNSCRSLYVVVADALDKCGDEKDIRTMLHLLARFVMRAAGPQRVSRHVPASRSA